MPDPRLAQALDTESGLEGFCLSAALAVIVTLAERLPRGSHGRRALAQAACPIYEALDDIPERFGGAHWVPRFTLWRRG